MGQGDGVRAGVRKASGTEPPQSQAIHVLLVDDDPAFLAEMGAQLADHVRSVRAVGSEREAFEVLGSLPVDVVVCDLVLRGGDGLALLERVRQTRPAIARVLVTGFGERLRDRSAFPAAQAVVYKPCEVASLAALIGALPGTEARAAQSPDPGAPGLRVEVTVGEGGHVRLVLIGVVDEAADLRGVHLPAGPLVLDLSGVRAVNAPGAQRLVLFLETVGADRLVSAERCSPAVVHHLNLLPELADRLAVRSVVAPLECPECGWERDVTVGIAGEGVPGIPVLSCERCGQAMELGDLPERFFSFLRPACE